MTLYFDQSKETSKRELRSPPNYSSRSTQLRLLVLVFALMAVIMAMSEARKTENYRWLGLDNEAPLAPNEIADVDRIDTRFRSGGASVRLHAETTVTQKSGEPSLPVAQGQWQAEGFLARKTIDVWSDVLGRLSAEQRRVFSRMLRALQLDQRPSADDRERWLSSIETLDQSWDDFHQETLPGVLEMPDEDRQKASWLVLLQQLETDWSYAKEVLTSTIAESESVPGGNREPGSDSEMTSADPLPGGARIEQLQKILDAIALRRVKDNTRVNRSTEHEAWFRLLDQLSHSSVDKLKEASTGRVGFLQLFRQPEIFRGKLVTIRGSVRAAYYIRSPGNRFSIDGYHVCVIRPAGGPNSPILVYALNLPEAFLSAGSTSAQGDSDPSPILFNEEVEVTGYFFKNSAYAAHDGARVAPLILARNLDWQPALASGRGTGLPDLKTIVFGLLAVVGIAITIATIVYRQTRGRAVADPRYKSITRSGDLDELPPFEPAEVAPPIQESLQNLATRSAVDARGRESGLDHDHPN